MKIGIFPGIFNPPHIAHLIMVCDFYEKFNLDKVYIVPTKQYETDKEIDVSPYDRFEMVKEMVKGYNFIEVSDFEVNSDSINYTYITIQHFKKVYKNKDDQIYLLVGMDWFDGISKWKNFEYIYSNAIIVFYLREINILNFNYTSFDKYNLKNNFNKLNKNEIDKIKINDGIFIIGRFFNISSTEIREKIKNNKPFKQFLTNEVYNYIINKGLYLK